MFKKIGGFGIPLLFILPVLGFLSSLFDIKSKTSAVVYVAFAMLFGYAISFADTSADSFRYAQAFNNFDNTLDYNTIVTMYRSGELRDMYRLLLFYFVSQFSNNPKVMYAFAGLVYGVFSYLSILLFTKERTQGWDTNVFILALIFYTYVSLSNINGFRFNTGALVLFYSSYQFIIRKKRIWLFGILLTSLFHYGFILIVPALVIYRFIQPIFYDSYRVKPLLLYLFILAFALSWILGINSINLGFLSQADLLPDAVGNRVEYVNSEDTANLVKNRADNSSFLSVQKYFVSAIKIYVFIAILFINRLFSNMHGDDKIKYTSLLSFVMFFYAFSFIATSIPSGGRFLNIAHLFLMTLMIKVYNVYRRKNYKNLITLSLPAFAFTILFTNLMVPILILTPTFWYGNLFWIIIEGLNLNSL